MTPNICAGLDIGTSKVCAVVAEIRSKDMHILGIGTSPAKGVRKGMIVSIDAAVESIRKAVHEAQSISGTRIKSVSVGISGGHIKGFSSSGTVGVRGKEVTHKDIERAIDSAKTVYIPLDREILHVIPAEFILDEQEGIVDPLGMAGVRLEAKAQIITGAVSSVQNVLKCCEKAGLDVSEVVAQPVATSHAVISQEEKELGVILIDIGGGTSDIALFKDGYLRHISVLGIGGAHITNDIAIGLKVNIQEAERLKKASGAAFGGMIDQAEEIQITQSGDQQRSILRKYLVEIIQPRSEEMLEMIRKEIHAYEPATCGAVLTGGTSLLNGFGRMAETVLALPVRIGRPETNRIKHPEMSPEFATGIGLAAYIAEAEKEVGVYQNVFAGAWERCRVSFNNAFKYVEFLNLYNRKEGGVLCLKSKK